MPKAKRKLGTKAIIAATFSTDVSEVGSHYQREVGVYVMGDDYFACGHKPPQLDGRDWKKHKDQFWANQNGTVLWVATALDGS